MTQNQTLDLSDNQRSLLLEGLRYLRSSRKLAFRDPLAPPDAQREGDLREIADLMSHLDVAAQAPVRAKG